MATWSLFILVTTWSVRILLKCFLVGYYFYSTFVQHIWSEITALGLQDHLVSKMYLDFRDLRVLYFLSAGLALLIAQGSVNKGETDKLNGENKSGPESDDQLQSHDELDSIKDLDSSGPEHHDVYVSEPETRL